MSNKKKNKYPAKNNRARQSGRIVVKSGAYDGSTSSDDFVVTGHSTGSKNSEMEELSMQVSRDAGRVPEVPLDYAGQYENETDEYHGYEGEGLGDLGGPEFYGNKPSLLGKSPIHFANEARRLTMGTAAAAIAGSAVLAGLAYALIRNVRASSKQSGAAKTAGRTVRAGAAAKATSVAAKKSRAKTASKSRTKKATAKPAARRAKSSDSRSRSESL